MHAMQCLVPILRGALHSVQRKVNVLAERTDREVGMIHSRLLGEYSAAHPVHRDRIISSFRVADKESFLDYVTDLCHRL